MATRGDGSGKDGSLRLEAVEYRDPRHWRWRLTDANGAFLTDHEVALDPGEPEYGAFLDLEGYLHRYAAPDRRQADEARLLRGVGEWMGRRVLGVVGEAILKHGTPAVVRVVVPPDADGLLHRPLELAHARGRPLGVQDVSLVFEVAGEAPEVIWRPVGDRLRMLAVFSLPTSTNALALRRERHALKRRVQTIAQTHGLAIELRILQYGVTREALRDVLEEGAGWDVLHFSGHGLTGSVLLEQADGSRDTVPAAELTELLRPARGQLKLVSLSACLSAAATLEETLRWLRIQPGQRAAEPVGEDDEEDEAERAGADIRPRLPAVARALVSDLDCAVLAMRFPVEDEFAIALADGLYDRLFGDGHPLPRSLQLALRDALGKSAAGEASLSAATPALFGRTAAALRLQPPRRAVRFAVQPSSLAAFPPEPERFVGRVGALARASAAMAPASGQAGVLFHGMAGAGKTACALELAYRYEQDRFGGFVWYKAPDEGTDDNRADVSGALLGLALAMEQQLPDFAMAHVLEKADELAAFLPRLREVLERNSILLVLDNLESLLTSGGTWRDERWGQLVETLLGHNGVSRTILTSRRVPALPAGRVLVEAVHALSLDEAALLARELPHLGKLMHGEGPVDAPRGRALVARTLEVVQGHPKLLELADGMAADPSALAAQLERAAEAWAGDERRLERFFRQGESDFGAADFLAALETWTRAASAALPPAAQTMFWFLCCLDEPDRQTGVIAPVWPHLWRRLERPGEAPKAGPMLAALAAGALVEPQDAGGGRFTYNLHPGVAEAGWSAAGEAFRPAVDRELAAFWLGVFQQSEEAEAKGAGRMLVHAASRGASYLLRLKDWDLAGQLLERATARDRSPAALAAALPLLALIAEETKGTADELAAATTLASALRWAGRPEAETMLRDMLERAEAGGEFRFASVAAGQLIDLLRESGRAEGALALAGRMAELTRRAGLGPWTQMVDEGQRLQLLADLGRYQEVLVEVQRLRERMAVLPEQSDQEEATIPWNVREGVLDTGRSAATHLERWEEALSLNAEVVASQEARGASELELARRRFNDYFPLLSLGRHGEAQALLYDCRAVFEREGDILGLGKVFGALADLEDKFGRYGQAIRYQETALRFSYLAGEPEDCGISHHNLSNNLKRAGRARAEYLAHALADGLICLQSGSGRLAQTVRNLAIDFVERAPEPPPLPASFDDLCQAVEQVEGVHFRELFARLPRRAGSGDEALAVVVRLAQELAAQSVQQAQEQQTQEPQAQQRQAKPPRRRRKRPPADGAGAQPSADSGEAQSPAQSSSADGNAEPESQSSPSPEVPPAKTRRPNS